MSPVPAYLATLVLSLGLAAPASAHSPEHTPAATVAQTAPVLQTKMALRDLWVEHVFWIRGYVLAQRAGDAAQAKVAEAEVVSNARALAASVVPFYGAAAGDALFQLLAGHWGAVKDYQAQTAAGSRDGQSKAVKALTDNARAIAKFLSGANPYLPEDAVFGLLAAHGAHHVAQIDAVQKRDYATEARTWAPMRQHMLGIADAITDALARQFPGKF